MAIRTVEDLYDYLTSETAWRKKELAALRTMVEATAPDLAKSRALVRAAITLLYAHWEGFVKTAGKAYLEYVAFQRLTHGELADNFLALAMRTVLNVAAESSKAAAHTAVVEAFRTRMGERATIMYKTLVHTESNLSSRVLREIVDMLGLSYDVYETKEKLIDDRLLRARNTIAHGEYLTVDTTEYLELQQEFIGLIDTFRNQVDNAAALKSYRLPVAAPTG